MYSDFSRIKNLSEHEKTSSSLQISFLFLHTLRHLFGAACQAGIFSAASRAEMTDVEQMKKIVPFVTCVIPFCQHVDELMSGINVSNLNFTIKINSVKHQFKATLWILDTCLIVGLRPLIICLIKTSLSSKIYNMALEPECVPLDRT